MSTATSVEMPTGFHALTLHPSLQAAIDRVGYTKPTPIQAAVIPKVLAGRDVVGQAQTGTGKTAAFLIPFLNSWQDTNEQGPEALILVPTRELVVQVCEEARKLAPSKNFRAVPIVGGERFRGQLDLMRKGYSLAVGTPGRILDHMGRGTLHFNRVRYVVLDEGDRMLDIGFRPDIERILRRCPTDRQTLMMSATLPQPVLRLAMRYMHKPLLINLSPKRITVAKIRQSFITVDKERKFDLLMKVIEREQPKQCIIFCERKRWAQRVYEDLNDHHERAAVMHGDLEQPQRNRIMKQFRDGEVKYLVATDLVGRGIDVMGISHIINYDLPDDPENYVHRIGRTGRMGKNGIAIAFVTIEQGEQLTRIENFINQEIAEDRIDGFEAFAPRVKAAPEEPKEYVPIFGRRGRKNYSKRL